MRRVACDKVDRRYKFFFSALHPAARVHGVDGIFVDRWGLRIFLNVVFGVFPKRSAQEVENGVEAPQSKISLEGYSPQKCSW